MSIIQGKFNALVIWHEGPMSEEAKKANAEKQKHLASSKRASTERYLAIDVSEHQDLVRIGLKFARLGTKAISTASSKGIAVGAGSIITATQISYGDGKPTMVLAIE